LFRLQVFLLHQFLSNMVNDDGVLAKIAR
jgi:hypothetical protein